MSNVNSAGAQVILVYLIMVPEFKSSGAGNSNMPKRSRKVLLLGGKVNILDLIGKEKIMLRLLRSTVRMNLLLVKS